MTDRVVNRGSGTPARSTTTILCVPRFCRRRQLHKVWKATSEEPKTSAGRNDTRQWPDPLQKAITLQLEAAGIEFDLIILTLCAPVCAYQFVNSAT